jgi:hypothetical protein
MLYKFLTNSFYIMLTLHNIYYYIVTASPTVFIRLVILLWQKFIYEEISECNVNKSGNHLYIYAPNGSTVAQHFQFISSLACVKIKYIQYTSSTYLLLSQQYILLF